MNPLLMPAVLVQGMRARANTPMLPPANGPTSGAVGSEAGLPLRLAVLGESTAAGEESPPTRKGSQSSLAA